VPEENTAYRRKTTLGLSMGLWRLAMNDEAGEALRKWAHVERQFLQEDMNWLKAGARLLSPSGDDITSDQISRLMARIEHVNALLVN
jgi:hypothetical protein